MKELAKSVIEENGKFLLLKRTPKSKNFPELWDFPGGKLDPGETPTEAAVREAKEETGLDIVPGDEIKETMVPFKDSALIFHYFIPEEIHGSIRLSRDHTDHRWCTPKEMEELDLHPSVTSYFK